MYKVKKCVDCGCILTDNNRYTFFENRCLDCRKEYYRKYRQNKKAEQPKEKPVKKKTINTIRVDKEEMIQHLKNMQFEIDLCDSEYWFSSIKQIKITCKNPNCRFERWILPKDFKTVMECKCHAKQETK